MHKKELYTNQCVIILTWSLKTVMIINMPRDIFHTLRILFVVSLEINSVATKGAHRLQCMFKYKTEPDNDIQ